MRVSCKGIKVITRPHLHPKDFRFFKFVGHLLCTTSATLRQKFYYIESDNFTLKNIENMILFSKKCDNVFSFSVSISSSMSVVTVFFVLFLKTGFCPQVWTILNLPMLSWDLFFHLVFTSFTFVWIFRKKQGLHYKQTDWLTDWNLNYTPV